MHLAGTHFSDFSIYLKNLIFVGTILSENWGKSLISLNLVPANRSVLKVFQGLVSVLISDVRILILEVSDGRVPLYVYVECAPCWCVII